MWDERGFALCLRQQITLFCPPLLVVSRLWVVLMAYDVHGVYWSLPKHVWLKEQHIPLLFTANSSTSSPLVLSSLCQISDCKFLEDMYHLYYTDGDNDDDTYYSIVFETMLVS